ncbi:hypothetical protein GIB67_028025 [Kingdonia uniflora]|uniref:Fungal lipase-type domain-containing protein n=1 Tax=Kingdonia uniflora TaxID=39325 RepID=A0A7J7NE62_9MAGN|nr:hypothetical protein GIB67_028025 [Kingdonia uniflora]
MEGLQNRVETWIIDQSKRIPKVSWAQLRWPPWKNGREERKMLQEEYARRKKQLQDLCHAVKADSVGDLQDILCSMTLSECVYKRPGTEIVRVMNKFKADFGGQVVSLERVEPSLDHVSHRYLLAEAGDTLFVSFIGTKQYKDLIVDANILQGSIFHDEIAEDIVEDEIIESKQVEDQNKKIKFLGNSFQTKSNQLKPKPKPAAHRGFLARAKGIPALELYRLAQKKNRKLVLCGHSLGGAVAALATLAILRVMTASSLAKENEKVQVKCITFSQPPVGNAALRDYVHEKGWGQHFRTYCIPEDLVPRILSPAYFHHYNAQPSQMAGYAETITRASLPVSQIPKERSRGVKSEENEGDQLVLGLGPVQNSFWRLSKLVPLQGVQKQLSSFMGKNIEQRDISSATNAGPPSTIDEVEAAPQFLEIQEGSDGISLKPFSNIDEGEPDDLKSGLVSESSTTVSVDSKGWRRVPYLPSYVPFGQVKSVITELKERFQSHSMRSYRSRFQK